MRATAAAKVGSDLIVVFAAIIWRENYHAGGNDVTHLCRSNTIDPLIGWTVEDSNPIRVFDRTGRMLGFYFKSNDTTHGTHGFFGFGNQVLRLLK